MANKGFNNELMRMASGIWMQSYKDEPSMDVIKFAIRHVCDIYRQMPGASRDMIMSYVNDQFPVPVDAVDVNDRHDDGFNHAAKPARIEYSIIDN